MKPNIETYNPDPEYLRQLVENSGLSQRQAAKAIGHNERTMRYWLAGRHEFPYSVQYIMEALARYQECDRSGHNQK